MPRKYKHQRSLQISLAINIIITYACLIITAAALTRHYANLPEPTVPSNTSHLGVTGKKTQPTLEVASEIKRPDVGNSGNLGKPAQSQKDAAARVAARVYEARKEIIEAQGVSRELFLTTAYNDLLAMAFHESSFDCSRVGDQGRSVGCFQVQTKLHGVTVAQAQDFEWAAEWTLDRMVRDTNYPRFRHASLRRHNGSGPAAEKYALAVKATSANFEKQGL